MISPTKSLVRNEGFIGEATNCKSSYNLYQYEFNDSQTEFTAIPDIEYIKSIDKSANRYWSVRYRVYGKVMSLIYKFLSK